MATALALTFSGINSAQRRTLVAAALGWMLDAFDAMLYALVLAHVMRDLHMTPFSPASLPSVWMVAWAAGYVLVTLAFGVLGFRKRAL